MARFRKRPLEIEAVQNDGTWPPIMAWLDDLAGGRLEIPFGHRPAVTRNDDGSLSVDTGHGTAFVAVGAWLLCGVEGELYPCEPGVFDATYEAVD